MTSYRNSELPNKIPAHPQGFTLIELVMVIILVGILSAISFSMFGTSVDAQKYEDTRLRMETIRVAILGDQALDATGHRTHFGYHGDYGKLPTSLSDLTTAQAPAWAFSSTYGIGAGWRGPYLESGLTGSVPPTQDAWGKNFVYSPAANPATLTSYASDGAAGGSLYAKDLTLTFADSSRLGTVHGFAADGDTRLSGKTVEIRYPVSGTLTAFTSATDVNGYFTFPNVPMGVRSLAVTDAPTMGPRRFAVDSSIVEVPNSTLNYYGALQAVKYVSASSDTGAPANSTVTASLSSTYISAVQADYITIGWVRPSADDAFLRWVTINGVEQLVSNLTSNTRIDITAVQTFPANSSTNTVELRFADHADGSGNINMRDTEFSLVFEWVGSTEKDTVGFRTPN